MTGDPSRLSPSVEDYLKAIYSLSERDKSATTNAIAEALHVQPGSVSGMIKRLAKSSLLEHAPYHGVSLTGKGTREALRILRRHRVLESYLHLRLGYSWDDVHEEAERLEHSSSDLLIERMAAALENPRHDPHGAPIPTPSGEIELTDFLPLAEAHTGDELEIRSVRDEDPGSLRHLEALGLLPGVRLVVIDATSPGKGISVEVGPRRLAQVVSEEVAARIFVAYR